MDEYCRGLILENMSAAPGTWWSALYSNSLPVDKLDALFLDADARCAAMLAGLARAESQI